MRRRRPPRREQWFPKLLQATAIIAAIFSLPFFVRPPRLCQAHLHARARAHTYKVQLSTSRLHSGYKRRIFKVTIQSFSPQESTVKDSMDTKPPPEKGPTPAPCNHDETNIFTYSRRLHLDACLHSWLNNGDENMISSSKYGCAGLIRKCAL